MSMRTRGGRPNREAALSGEERRLLADEQAALRRVATLVAGEAAPHDVFAVVTEEVGRLLPVDFAIMGRFDDDASVTAVAAWGAPVAGFPIGSRWLLDGKNLVTIVVDTGRTARVDRFEHATGSLGVAGRASGFYSAVGTPIVVQGAVWGVMTVGSTRLGLLLPPDTEDRLERFTELLATAIANAESRAGLARLAEEQAALRRVATLVAQSTAPEDLFTAVVSEVGQLFPVELAMMGRYEPGGTLLSVATWGRAERFPPGTRRPLGGNNLGTIVFETGRSARVDDYADGSSGQLGDIASESGIHSSVATPIVVDGSLWGLIAAGTMRAEPLPADSEARLASFTELVATAIADAESRGALARLADEQATLRRVATLVARGVAPEEVFAAVTEEIGQLLPVDIAIMGRFECDGTGTVVASWGPAAARFPVGSRWKLEGNNLATTVYETGRPVRNDRYVDASGAIGVAGRESGFRSGVATPIIVEGRMWGVMVVGSTGAEPIAADSEERLGSFTELVAMAIANAESRAGIARLAEEQAALRRMATLVAHGTPPEELFAAVTNEVGRLLGVDYVHLGRYEPDATVTFLARVGARDPLVPARTRMPLGGNNVTTRVLETGRPARTSYEDASGPLADLAMEVGIRSSVGTSIIAEGETWGVMVVSSKREEPLPADTEVRLASFTGLVATAIANAESSAALARLAEEQAALRRVATLVARGMAPEDVFAAVAEEVGRLLPADLVNLCRYEADHTQLFVATWGRPGKRFPQDLRWPLGGKNLGTIVFETGRPARIEDFSDTVGPVRALALEKSLGAAVGAPIIVDGSLWGMVSAGSCELFPPGTEAQLVSFTELMATSIANAESRAALAASRARIVAASDDSRRRIERDLHDGAQQRLVHAVIVLKLALRSLSPGDAKAAELVAEALRHAEQASSELRELAHGILPAALRRGGLRAGIEGLVSRISLPVSVDVLGERLPDGVEAAAYFVVSEALTNVVKHARARSVTVTARVEGEELRVAVCDDGVGGARRSGHATGLGGLEDRVTAIGGRLVLESPPNGGTRLCARLPVAGPASGEAMSIGPEGPD